MEANFSSETSLAFDVLQGGLSYESCEELGCWFECDADRLQRVSGNLGAVSGETGRSMVH
jgi:hypothetical protein